MAIAGANLTSYARTAAAVDRTGGSGRVGRAAKAEGKPQGTFVPQQVSQAVSMRSPQRAALAYETGLRLAGGVSLNEVKPSTQQTKPKVSGPASSTGRAIAAYRSSVDRLAGAVQPVGATMNLAA